MLFPGVPERKTRSRLSEQNPPTLQRQSHTDTLWEAEGTTDGQFAPKLRVTGSQEQDGKPLAFFFSLSWEPLVWCHKVVDDRIMKLNSSCHESCLNLKTRQSPGDWTVSYAQLLECHQITLFFQKVNEAFVQNLDVVTVILKWSSNCGLDHSEVQSAAETFFGQITNCTKLWISFYIFKHSEF